MTITFMLKIWKYELLNNYFSLSSYYLQEV